MSAAEQRMTDIGERLTSRFYGKYRGTVTSVDADTLRVKAKVPAVLDVQESGWCTPCVPYAGAGVGMAFIPEVGAAVWIEFEAGDISHPIWSGCYWRAGELPSDAAPKVKVIVTPGGGKLLLDDDGTTITLSDANGNTVKLDSGGVTIERGGHKLVVSDAKLSVDDTAFVVQ